MERISYLTRLSGHTGEPSNAAICRNASVRNSCDRPPDATVGMPFLPPHYRPPADRARERKQSVVWSFTIPTACMNA
jgi:hypothetical protein